MNVLIVAQNYHPLIGGVETHARQIAHELGKTHRVRVVAGNFTACKLPQRLTMLHTSLLAPAAADYQDGEVPVHALTPQKIDRLKMLPIALRATPKLQRYAYQELSEFGYQWYRSVYFKRLLQLMQNVDVVHSLAGGYLGWTAQEAAQALGIPFVCTPFVHPNQWGDDKASRLYYQRSQAVIALLESDRQYLLSSGVSASKLHIIGVSPDLPQTTDPISFRQRHSLENVPFVLYIGRMMPQKGAKALLEATKQVWQQHPETRFVFIGPQLAESATWFDQVDSRILYLGKVSHQEKADALAACNIFCMPSLSEILPTVYLEAWSYKKPVIGGRAEGLPALVEDNQAGISVSQDPTEIAQAIVTLMDHPDLSDRYGQMGQALIDREYKVEAVVKRLETLYGSLIDHKRSEYSQPVRQPKVEAAKSS